MNNRTDKEKLLAEVLAEASPADFRAALLAETLRLAHRRRLLRQTWQAVGVLALISLLAVLVAQQFSKLTPVAPPPLTTTIAKRSYQLVRTQPLSASALISTRNQVSLAVPISKVTEVATTGGGFRSINDDELLAFLADKPAALIRTGPHSEELVFANPDDQRKLLIY